MATFPSLDGSPPSSELSHDQATVWSLVLGRLSAAGDRSTTGSARGTCRELRDIANRETAAVRIQLHVLNPDSLAKLVAGGRWLVTRWPHCRKATLLVDDASVSTLALPFATAPSQARNRITELTIQPPNPPCEPGITIPCDGLLALLQLLPGLTALTLRAHAPPQRPLVSHALSFLPRLTSLTVADWAFVDSIPDCMAGQLTRLTLSQRARPHGLCPRELAAPFSRLTGLRELTAAQADDFWPPEDASALLAAAPGSLRSLRILNVGPDSYNLDFDLSNGLLDALHVSKSSWHTCYPTLSGVLASVIPADCPALGPEGRQVPLLGLQLTLEVLGALLPATDAFRELCLRFRDVQLEELRADASIDVAITVMRLLGTPERLTWRVHEWNEGTLRLRPSPLRTPGGGGGGDGGGHGGRGVQQVCGSSRTAPSPLAVLPAAAVAERALERMGRAAAEGRRPRWLVLRGPLIRRLTASPGAFRAWLQRLRADDAANFTQVSDLPGVGAALVSTLFGRAERLEAAVKRLAAGGGGGGTRGSGGGGNRGGGGSGGSSNRGGGGGDGGGQAAGALETLVSGLDWTEALRQVLQSL
ncbi:hypothetical protein HYH03_016422 [Edaphochlamys debaryana]|uniref:Uncharacterized protein n=1 Tax=Edaphochlamys debaryana TaxID=47281 RepID=A0A836BRL9_9CHLO|nr:hypothetical protein HYH03_016422 [Edaphochlamys debaryana]|eukprot:KAG2484768.1 hypothetical protein HYH03_016422 [Edaphochlamys debaryana]